MRLEQVHFKGFRSIQDVILSHCGGFNVLIGKNNAGKSNVLLGINAFFECIRNGEPVNITPPIGRPIDFHGQLHRRIELTLTFQLSADDRASVTSDVSSETPQMKNAIENLEPDLRLRITVIVLPALVPFSYVSKMSLCPPGHPEKDGATRLLEVSEPAAIELFDKARLAQSKDNEVESMKRILDSPRALDDQMWQAMKAEAVPTRYFAYYLREMPNSLNTALAARIDGLIKSSESPTAFMESLKQLSAAAAKESLDVRTLPLKSNRIESFSGQQSTIPAFALKMLRRVANLKVLYLTERREPIGHREAGQLLELKVKRGVPEKLRAIQEIVVALLGVEIDAFRGEQREGAAELDVDRFLVQANGAGISSFPKVLPASLHDPRPNLLPLQHS